MPEDTFRLVTWMRFATGDGLGIPVFADNTNKLFLPETDNLLRMQVFHEFYNEEGFRLEYALPLGAAPEIYQVGDHVPIPFSQSGKTVIVDVARGLDAFKQDFAGISDQAIYGIVADVLQQAETRRFQLEAYVRSLRRFEEPFPDVFAEPPVHSRYWLDRFEAACLARLILDPETREGIATRLREIFQDWLRRFATSGEISLHDRACNIVLQTELLPPEVTKDFFLHLVSRTLGRRDYRKLRDKGLISAVIKRVPEGVYHYQVFSAQTDTIEAAAGTKVDVLDAFRDTLYEDLQGNDFRNTLCVSILLFGRDPLPSDILKDISQTIEVLTDRLHFFWHSSLRTNPLHPRENFPPTPEAANNYRALNTLRRVADWQNRAGSGRLPTGLDRDLDSYLERTIGSPVYDWRTATND